MTTEQLKSIIKEAIEKATYEEWGNCPNCSEEFSYTEFDSNKAADNVIESLKAIAQPPKRSSVPSFKLNDDNPYDQITYDQIDTQGGNY